MKFSTALAVSAGAHAALVCALSAWIGGDGKPDDGTLAAIDVSAVELSIPQSEAPGEESAPQPPDEDAAPHPAQATPPAVAPAPEAPLSPPDAPVPPPDVPAPAKAPENAADVEPPSARTLPPPQKTIPPETKKPQTPQTAAAAPPSARIDAPARPRRAIKPEYPVECRRKRQQGKVVVKMGIDAAGRAFDVAVASSSGVLELDAAAVKAIREARFAPARSGGKPVASEASIVLEFKLDK